jgi:anti-sigma factor RsiW
MECKEAMDLISAYSDGELDAAQRAQAERHINDCPQCNQALQSITALKAAMLTDGLKFNAPGALLKRVNSLLDKAVDPPATKPAARILHPKWIAFAAGLTGIAAILAITFMLWPTQRQRVENDAVARYQQSPQAAPVVDVASSDPKTVFAWFTGKLNFAPFPPTTPPAGYTLAGGRLDHFGGVQVATLLYQNGSHLSQVSEWPAPDSPSEKSSRSAGGLNISSWNNSGWGFVVVSDDSGPPLQQLPNLFVAPGCGPR